MRGPHARSLAPKPPLPYRRLIAHPAPLVLRTGATAQRKLLEATAAALVTPPQSAGSIGIPTHETLLGDLSGVEKQVEVERGLTWRGLGNYRG